MAITVYLIYIVPLKQLHLTKSYINDRPNYLYEKSWLELQKQIFPFIKDRIDYDKIKRYLNNNGIYDREYYPDIIVLDSLFGLQDGFQKTYHPMKDSRRLAVWIDLIKKSSFSPDSIIKDFRKIIPILKQHKQNNLHITQYTFNKKPIILEIVLHENKSPAHLLENTRSDFWKEERLATRPASFIHKPNTNWINSYIYLLTDVTFIHDLLKTSRAGWPDVSVKTYFIKFIKNYIVILHWENKFITLSALTSLLKNELFFKEGDFYPHIYESSLVFEDYIALDKETGVSYIGEFSYNYPIYYVLFVILFFTGFMSLVNILFKKFEDSFSYLTQTAEDSILIQDPRLAEKKLLGYIQSFFNPVELVSKNFLPGYKQELFKENHKRSIKNFTDIIRRYVELRQQELLLSLKIRNETRQKIATDLHDDIGATLTKISTYSDTIRSSGDVKKIKATSEKIGALSRTMITSFSDVIWAIDSGKDTITDLIDRMYDLAYDLLAEKNIKVNFKADSFNSVDLAVEVRQNVYLIYKEVLNNIIKHARANTVHINIKKLSDGFELFIKDNGQGFNVTRIQKGNGLHNMQKRADKINAYFKIDADDGVNIFLKVKSLLH